MNSWSQDNVTRESVPADGHASPTEPDDRRVMDALRHGMLAVDRFRVCWVDRNSVHCALHGTIGDHTHSADAGDQIVRIALDSGVLCVEAASSRLLCWRFDGPQSLTVEPMAGIRLTDVALWHAGARLCVVSAHQRTVVQCVYDGDEKVFASDIVAVGDRCVVLEDGTLWCWGPMADCNLGPECSAATCEDPVLFPLRPIREIDGTLGRCALSVDGEATCFGFPSQLGFGDGSEMSCRTRGVVRVVSPTPFVTVRVQPSAACGLTQSRELYCWGTFVHDALRSRGADWRYSALIARGVRAFDLYADYFRFRLCFVVDGGEMRCL